MMTRVEIVKAILKDKFGKMPKQPSARAFAPSNIALCKYWGKRNVELNLPITGSLSISLGNHGTTTALKLSDSGRDEVILNGEPLDKNSAFCKRLSLFLNLFREEGGWSLEVSTDSNIPTAAGLASSASGFAALILAMDKLFGWDLPLKDLSILARLGSGSACRSLWQGFVEWHVGHEEDGMDSHGEELPYPWQEFCIGILLLSTKEKQISSTVAMQRTLSTSSFYSLWPQKVAQDIATIHSAIKAKDFLSLGQCAESNALAMHATMLTSWPPISYATPETMAEMHHIWHLRSEGLPLFFTQDAGPNLKLLFLESIEDVVKEQFPRLDIIKPFHVHVPDE